MVYWRGVVVFSVLHPVTGRRYRQSTEVVQMRRGTFLGAVDLLRRAGWLRSLRSRVVLSVVWERVNR